jgi:hypothetical protein
MGSSYFAELCRKVLIIVAGHGNKSVADNNEIDYGDVTYVLNANADVSISIFG